MKPEAISTEAMDVAVSIEKDIPSRVTGTNRVFIRAVIARAITAAVAAEREACAVAAEALERGEREWVRDSLWANIKADTAAAIRARSAP